MKFYLIAFLTLMVLFSCKDDTAETGPFAYIGGEIINPNNDYVTIKNKLKGSDTIYLDQNNRFLYKIKELQPGLYSFTHGGEYQMVLLEPNDSILFRLNTNDFDESLVFTGNGAKKNNYLIKMFLENEGDNKKISNYFLLEPEEFMRIIDSSRTNKFEELNEFISKNNNTKLFKPIAEANINYNYYSSKEIFPFGYYGNNKLIHYKDLPDSYYDFRSEVDLNNEDFSELYVYNRFLFWHINNLALKDYYKNGNHDHVFDRQSLSYNLEKLDLIDSLVSNPTIKNYLLKHTAREFIFDSKDENSTQTILSSYLDKATNEDDKESTTSLVVSMGNLMPGKKLPNIAIIDFNNNDVYLNDIITKPTVIFYWSSNFKMHFRNSHYKIKELKTKFPDVNFIAINTNDDDPKYWRKTINQYKYPTENEYKFKNPIKASKVLVPDIDKVLLVSADKTIFNSNIGLYYSELENELKRMAQK